MLRLCPVRRPRQADGVQRCLWSASSKAGLRPECGERGAGEEAWLLLTASPLGLSQSHFTHRRRDSSVGAEGQGGDTVCKGAGIPPGLTAMRAPNPWAAGERRLFCSNCPRHLWSAPSGASLGVPPCHPVSSVSLWPSDLGSKSQCSHSEVRACSHGAAPPLPNAERWGACARRGAALTVSLHQVGLHAVRDQGVRQFREKALHSPSHRVHCEVLLRQVQVVV